jgi:hypothetical protein
MIGASTLICGVNSSFVGTPPAFSSTIASSSIDW